MNCGDGKVFGNIGQVSDPGWVEVEVAELVGRIQLDWAQGDAKVTSLNGWYRRSIRGIRREDHHVRHGQGPALVRAEQDL